MMITIWVHEQKIHQYYSICASRLKFEIFKIILQTQSLNHKSLSHMWKTLESRYLPTDVYIIVLKLELWFN